jgi:hypothetical protein
MYGQFVTGAPVVLSVKFNERGPHFDTPSAGAQLLLTVSGIWALIKIVWTASVDLTVKVVIDARKVVGGIVNKEGSNWDLLQLQSDNAPNPPKYKFLPAVCCTTMISFA